MLRLRPSKKLRFSAEGALQHAAGVLLLLLCSAAAASPQAPASSVPLTTHIANLSAFDYQTRTNAARLIRRAPIEQAVPALVEAVRNHPDQFVRYRGLVVLTSFSDRGTGDLMRTLIRDRNDRVREVAYKWLEANADGRLVDTLLPMLQTEQAEFVRPALVGALAALGNDSSVQRALLMEVSRGLDFFRSAVIDALGRHHATYAVDAIAAVAKLEGPLQDDAVLALGRIGGGSAGAALNAIPNPVADIVPTIRAARCLIGDGCEASIKAFVENATRSGNASAVIRASISALGVLSASGSKTATDALVSLGLRGGSVRAQAALAFAEAAVRSPSQVLSWFDSAATTRDQAIDLLKDGFEDLEEDFGEEMFFAATRATYWKADEKSATRTLTAALIQKLEF